MPTPPRLCRFSVVRHRRICLAATLAAFIASMAGVSAHIVRGVTYPTLTSAFVSSPSAGADAPIKITWGAVDTRLRVVCFNVANTSPARVDDPDWPRVTDVGFELPGAPSGFTLLEPQDGEWELVEGRRAAIPGHATVSLDFALIARVNRAGWFRKGPHAPLGIPPGQPAVRGSGTRFCVSGPFPDTLPVPGAPSQPPIPTTIENILNGVVVAFHRVQPRGLSPDVGLWESPLRAVPLYAE